MPLRPDPDELGTQPHHLVPVDHVRKVGKGLEPIRRPDFDPPDVHVVALTAPGLMIARILENDPEGEPNWTLNLAQDPCRSCSR